MILCSPLAIDISTGLPLESLRMSHIDSTPSTLLPATDKITSPILISPFLAGEKTPSSAITSVRPITVAPSVFTVNPAGIPPRYRKSSSAKT